MRLVVNALSLRPGVVGGGETYLANLTGGMDGMLRAGERMTVLCVRECEALFPLAGARSRVLALPLPGRIRPARLALEHVGLPFLLAGLRADVLLSPGNALPLLAGVRHVLALQSMHYRYVGEDMHPARVRYFRTLVPLSAMRAARVLCMSEDLRRSLAEVAPRAARRARVVHEGADLSRFRPAGPRRADGPYLLCVSSLNPFKRPDGVVRALAVLKGRGEDPPPVLFAGRADPADRARVLDLARSEGVAKLVTLLGVVSPDELAELYRGARLLVYPSALETFGLPPLEAMACGCPVVASNRSSVPEVTGDAAVSVDPDDIESLADAIRRVLEDDVLRRRLVERGFRNVARFSWVRAARETLEAVREAAVG